MNSIAICVIGRPTPLFHDVSLVIDKLLTAPADEGRAGACAPTDDGQQVLACVLAQARRFLARRGGLGELHVYSFESPEAFRAATRQELHPLRGGLSVELFFVDLSASAACCEDAAWAETMKRQLIADCRANGLATRLSPHSFTFFLGEDHPRGPFLHAHGTVHARALQADAGARRADIVRLLLDHLDHAHFNRILARAIDAPAKPVSLAVAMRGFMHDTFGERWDFHSFTGSVVSAFIDSMGQLLEGSGVRCLSAPNEHGLACAALAGWQLFDRAYVIAVTSGMVDEFKGTLANLRRARAPGLIVCADSASAAWFAFQGTIAQEGDGRALMQARSVPHVYLENAEDAPRQLQQAFAWVRERAGPVVVFATPAVLESFAPWPAEAAAAPRPGAAARRRDDGFDEALRIVNEKDAHLLWQCGRLSDAERALVYEAARRGGIALADSLVHPGSVAAYDGAGRPVDGYLGTLGLYAFSRRVHRFLHEGDELLPPQAQSLFFLKSKVDQVSTPFSEGKLARGLHVVQVNREPRDFAPFADVKVQMDTREFLERMVARIDVPEPLLARRRRRIEAMRALPASVPVDWIETLPMTANYFFHRLAGLLQQLIEHDGYRYTGVYDVGRCALSALRNLPRTGPGFSGWYGRALMGDALMALPCIALNAPGHVLAFVGDGARGVVPDVEGHLAATLSREGCSRERNVTVFTLANGVFSMIQSYFDYRFSRHGGEQMAVPPRATAEGMDRRGPWRIHRRVIADFDAAYLREALLQPGRINFFEVRLAHNSSGDGMSLASESAWSRAAQYEGQPS